MNQLKNKHCKPCEGGVCPLDENTSASQIDEIPGWKLSADMKSIERKIHFKTFAETMGFINAMASMAEEEGHHPDFAAGYGYCKIQYTTHAIGGLSDNDFICAAKINAILES